MLKIIIPFFMLFSLALISCSEKSESKAPETVTTQSTDTIMKQFVKENLYWTREPSQSTISDSLITITTDPKTDLWQRTYYGFQNDNAPVLQMKTSKKYLDSENWMKASIEYENEEYQRLGSVVTNNGYSDWATHDIPSSIREMWYRLSRRNSDYYIETSTDGVNFHQMRAFHLFHGDGEISFGIYAASPVDHSFTAKFSNMEVSECKWASWSAQDTGFSETK